MNPIRLVARNRPLLLHEFFRSYFYRRDLKVFLCGSEEKDRFQDLRHHVKEFMGKDMQCQPFLGEHIPDLEIRAKKARSHLSIEVNEAEKSNMVVVFLDSPGTISELTAFALSDKINPKLLVFNQEQYRGKKTFINLGPLKLLSPEQIVYYSTRMEADRKEFYGAIVAHIDFLVARSWFSTYKLGKELAPVGVPDIGFLDFIILCVIYSIYPAPSVELQSLVPAIQSENRIRASIKILLKHKLIVRENKCYVPVVEVKDLPLPTGILADISRARLRYLSFRSTGVAS